jgi:hypothetical protein
MNQKLKNFLIVTAKNAVNAVLTNAALLAAFHGQFSNPLSKSGWWDILKVTLSVIGSREAIVWVPVILKWTTSNSDMPAPPPPAAKP